MSFVCVEGIQPFCFRTHSNCRRLLGFGIRSICIAFLCRSEAGLLRALFDKKVQDAKGMSAPLAATPESAAAASSAVTVEEAADTKENDAAGGHEEGEEEVPTAVDAEVEETDEKDVC